MDHRWIICFVCGLFFCPFNETKWTSFASCEMLYRTINRTPVGIINGNGLTPFILPPSFLSMTSSELKAPECLIHPKSPSF